jgi:hypothetical protein
MAMACVAEARGSDSKQLESPSSQSEIHIFRLEFERTHFRTERGKDEARGGCGEEF